jgi:hypothetical protein
VQIARDLANLPQFLCRQDDIVLVNQKPSVEFLSGIKQAGFALPEFVEMNRRAGLAERKLGRLRPWAWGPDSVELFEPIFANLTGEKRTASGSFNLDIAQLYSKAWSAALLKKFLHSRSSHWLCTKYESGVAVNSLGEALEAIATIRQRGHHKIVVKESLGLAGSNAMRLFEPELLESHQRWLVNALTNHRQLVVEPWLERALDFSVQLEMTTDGLKLCGYTGLLNDAKGQFQANLAAPGHQKKIPANLIALFPEPPDIAQRLHQLYADIFALLEEELHHANFLGPVGIDAFVYRGANGKCRLKPIVEINPRYTMGRLTVELMKHVAPGRRGLFRLVSRKQARAEGFEDFVACARSLNGRFPLRLEGEPTPKIRSGMICLNDPAKAEVCLALFQAA